MATTTRHPRTTIIDRSNALQGKELWSLFLSTVTHEMGHTRAIEDHFDKIFRVEGGIYGYQSMAKTHMMTNVFTYNPEIEWMAQRESPLTALLSDLRDLLKEENEDENGILKPTYHAFTTALSLIMEVSMFIHAGFPFAAVSTDSEGGIRIEWVKGRGEIRLIIPAASNTAPYIYYEFDDKYGVDRNASGFKLIRWINRLNRYGTNAISAYFSTVTL